MGSDDLALRHLLLRLRPINRSLNTAVSLQQHKAARLDRADLKTLCVTDGHVAALLSDVEEFVDCVEQEETPFQLAPAEAEDEQQLREQAATRGQSLPLDVITDALQLQPFESGALLVCAASELNADYERIFAYVLDDLNRRFPCVELLCTLAGQGAGQRLRYRSELGAAGTLRRCGLLEEFGAASSGLRTQLRLAPGVLDYLLGASPAVAGLWRDPDSIESSAAPSVQDSKKETRIREIGSAIANGAVGIVGLWGPDDAAPEWIAQAIAGIADMSLRRLRLEPDADRSVTLQVRTQVQIAAASNAILFVAADPFQQPDLRPLSEAMVRELACCEVPVVIAGTVPWRPTALLANRSYVELVLESGDHLARGRIWARTVANLPLHRNADLSRRFRMTHEEIRAAGRMAGAQAALDSNGTAATPDDHLDAACVAVAQKTRSRFLGSVVPRRGPSDLVLPDELHAQVLEVASFTRVLPKVAESWGFGRLATGGVGMKCLFTGDSGTGKTLAAEVIACQLGTALLKVDIAEVVSKWVGETERNLDAAFNEALAGNAVLFFDEADALFGKRGEVRHGIDRYANLEVGYLLQRLEEHDGLVILASNLKDNIDSAFTRRFQVLLHFPRPGEEQRRRIWDIAFPEQAPLESQVDLATLARLDMTGAGIVGAARTAALLAADEGAAEICMAHIVRSIARQYRREARMLPSADLGRHAALLRDLA